MEWVVTTGKTVEEAKDAALDELGVDEQDAEFEILEEPRAGLFGRVRGEARVRARIAPTRPRPKVERRDKRRRERKPANGGKGRGRAATAADGDEQADADVEAVEDGATDGEAGGRAATATTKAGAPAKAPAKKARSRAPRGGGRATDAGAAAPGEADDRAASDRPSTTGADGPTTDTGAEAAPVRPEGSDMSDTMTLEQQADAMAAFLEGLLDAFGLDGELARDQVDDETVELHVNGSDLGLLIGPKGQTLQAVQELARTVVQRRAAHADGRVRIDIGGYRQRRKEALERFTRQVAEEVRSSGVQKALEPMHPADRKVVHDVANTIDGVSTISEGEEPRRRVVITPA